MRSKLLCTALLLAMPLSAQAHVVLSEKEARPGAPYNAHFKVGHGCDGSPTTALTITIPDGVSGVRPQEKANWSAKTVREGSKVIAITFSGGKLAADMPGEFVIAMTLPGKEGPLAFPVLQTCEKGSENWAELPAADGHKLEFPAAILTLTKTPVNNDGGMRMAGMNMPGMAGGGGGGQPPAGVTVKEAWIRALPGTSGGYFTLHNGGSKPVVLTGADSPGCGMLMIHKSEDKGGMSSMSHVSEVPVAAGADVQFTPGGFHLMCMDTKAAITPGATVPVTLSFKDGGQLTTQFAVRNAAGK